MKTQEYIFARFRKSRSISFLANLFEAICQPVAKELELCVFNFMKQR